MEVILTSNLESIESRYSMSALPSIARPEPLWFFDNLAYVHVDGEQTAQAYSLGEVMGRRGDMPPLHVHHREDEAFYVLEGELRLFIADEQVTLRQGQAGLAPRGIPHVYRVESDEARWLVVTNPAGFEQFVRAISEPAPAAELPPAGRPVDLALAAELAARHGIELLGPPGTLPTDL
jgi:quercetin dioxygenase-like cupin family protein